MPVLGHASKLSARYHVLGRYLELHAEGNKFWTTTPTFVEVPSYGGWRFALQALQLGVPPVGTKVEPTPYETDAKFKRVLPIDTDDVLIETHEGLKSVKIEMVPLDAIQQAPGPVKLHHRSYSDVLTPISKALEGPFTLTISAQVPDKKEDLKSTVDIYFNSEYLKLASSKADNGTIEWLFEWAKIPTEHGENPQLVEVVTTKVWIADDTIITSRITQPYEVHFVELPTSAQTKS